jgi:hypothetical protein
MIPKTAFSTSPTLDMKSVAWGSNPITSISMYRENSV